MARQPAHDFRFRQTLADLKYHASCVPKATIWRIAAMAGHPSPGLLRSLEWLFLGKAPYSATAREPTAEAALILASALTDDDTESFRYATCLLLIGRLEGRPGVDNLFWRWPRVPVACAGAPPALRSAIMCGFREAHRRGRVDFGQGPAPEDCMTQLPEEVAEMLDMVDKFPEIVRLRAALTAGVSAQEAGVLWAGDHGRLWRLPDRASQAALAGFRHLYECPASIELPSDRAAPVIPPLPDLPDALPSAT